MPPNDYDLSQPMTLKAAGNRLARLPRRVNDAPTVIPITRRGRPVMALMSWELFEALTETIEIMSHPELMAQINRGERDAEAGRTVPLGEVLAELGIKPGLAPAGSDHRD